ncbi:MAG: hypothetical protein SW833_10915 [Cyanobacteriota bacterium]|nr:hypothetical protein [Cyanobacteriota bacterium]
MLKSKLRLTIFYAGKGAPRRETCPGFKKVHQMEERDRAGSAVMSE